MCIIHYNSFIRVTLALVEEEITSPNFGRTYQSTLFIISIHWSASINQPHVSHDSICISIQSYCNHEFSYDMITKSLTLSLTKLPIDDDHESNNYSINWSMDRIARLIYWLLLAHWSTNAINWMGIPGSYNRGTVPCKAICCRDVPFAVPFAVYWPYIW